MAPETDDAIQPARPLSALAEWHPRCYQRAAAFVTDPGGRLLVFDHLDVDAGTQVPAGGIHADEISLEEAEQQLWPAHAMWIHPVRLSLLHSI